MSHFRVYWPEESEGQYEEQDAGIATAVIPFTVRRTPRRSPLDAVSRAQVLFSNRTCPYCDYPVVEPLELDDAAINTAGLPIPGTSTLVGFHCHGCDAEWSV